MSRISWGSRGQRYFETGVDRGVLYLSNHEGVPWNGLKSVNESPSGGEPRPYYVDGYKYLNLAAAEEFAATINAYSSPEQFRECDGTKSIHNGLFATQQPRVPFALSYRTKIGNDKNGADHGYKLHMVYNALAAPSAKNNQTQNSSVTPLELSWNITTTPPKITGLKPTAHMIVDSRFTPAPLLAYVEAYLYGTDDTPPLIPFPEQLIEIFNSYGA